MYIVCIKNMTKYVYRRGFLVVIVFLFFRPFQVSSLTVAVAPCDLFWYLLKIEYLCIKIDCEENETLDFPRQIQTKTQGRYAYEDLKNPTRIIFRSCPLPKKPILETLKEININGSRVSDISFYNMVNLVFPIGSLFKGMPLKELTILSSYYEYYVRVNSTENLEPFNAVTYIINCRNDEEYLVNRIAVPPNLLMNVTDVKFRGCKTPNISYTDVLQNLNINVTSVVKLRLDITQNSSNLKTVNFKGLSLRKIEVSCEQFCEIDPKSFEETEKIDEVFLMRVQLKTIPPRTKKLTLIDGKFVSEFQINCSMLTELELKNSSVPRITGGWLSHCQNLTDITFTMESMKDVEQTLMGAGALVNLTFYKCYVRILYNGFAVDAVNVRRLKFKDCSLKSISDNAFNELKYLEELDLSTNRLSGFDILWAITPLKKLRKLIIDGNPDATFCEDYSRDKQLARHFEVEHLSYKFSKLSDICFQDWHNLTYLDLRYNSISVLGLEGLPVPRAHPLLVDLRENRLYETKEYYHADFVEKFRGSQNITILLDFTVDCDCEHSQFVNILRELPQISLQNATCKSKSSTDGKRLVDFDNERFHCLKINCGSCTCRTFWYIFWNQTPTTVDCDSRNLHTLPPPSSWQSAMMRGSNVTKISAAGNFIENFPTFENLNSLIELDLRNNKITHIPESALNAFLLDGNRRVRLSGNPFYCDCDTQDMLDALSKYKDQVLDYANLTCSNRESFPDSSLCTERALVTFGIVSLTLLALTAITAFIYIRYKLTIKAFLYARGLCLSCLIEEELDADKEYDAFVSYAYPDDELVNEELLPGLEKDYRLCVHTRNWMPGELINTQIVKSVEQSRRTIVVLSKNFVESVWGMTEFHTAYSNALREGRVRVICIVIDDVIDDIKNLDPELRSYLKSNTYLEFKDPFFWQKLRYAMPHRRVSSDHSGIHIQNGENGCQEIELSSRGGER